MEVTVNPGTTFRTLTPELVRLGAVRNADKFILLLRWMNYRDIPHALKPGRFRINTGWTPQQVIDQLVNGSPLLDRVTIPEGLAWWEVGNGWKRRRWCVSRISTSSSMTPPFCGIGAFRSTARKASCSRTLI